jgi:hypothetical protein
MKLRGFELANIDLSIGDNVYDLHNNFDFRGFSYDVATRELILRWSRGAGEWVPKYSPNSIEVEVHQVSHFSASARDPRVPYSEDDCLDCVAFVEAGHASSESFITAAPAGHDLHYVFQFMSGFCLRVQGEEATCKIS